MKLFNKDHDLIFKIANLILVVLLVGFMTSFWVNLMNVLIPERTFTYKEFKETYCDYGYVGYIDMSNSMASPREAYSDDECKGFYESETYNLDNQKYENKKGLFISLGNVLIVGFAIFILNGKKA